MQKVLFWLAAMWALLLIGGCGWLGDKTEPVARTPTSIDIQHAGLLVNDQGHTELGLSLRNTSPQVLWAVVRFQTPGGIGDCVLSSELVPASDHLFICPQIRLQPDANYPIQITVYSDLAQTQNVITLETGLRFSQADIQAAGL